MTKHSCHESYTCLALDVILFMVLLFIFFMALQFHYLMLRAISVLKSVRLGARPFDDFLLDQETEDERDVSSMTLSDGERVLEGYREEELET